MVLKVGVGDVSGRPRMALERWCSSQFDGYKQGKAATDGTSFFAVANKARGHVGSALNAFCPTVPDDKLVQCRYFPPLVCHCGNPFDI